MKIKRVSPELTEIDGAIRVESGPARIEAVATEELLSNDVTASHYYAGTKMVDGVEKVGVDANGKPIKLGQKMTYIDWRNRRSNIAWYVYAKDETGRFAKVGTHDKEDDAMSQATSLAAERAAGKTE